MIRVSVTLTELSRRIGRVVAPTIMISALALTTARKVEAQTPDQPPTVPMPEGVLPLPHTSPPTGLQAPLPTPRLPLAHSDSPLKISPQLDAAIRANPITIQDAVAIALATNRDLALAGEALLKAEGRTAEARSALFPTWAGLEEQLHYSSSQNVTFNGQTFALLVPDQTQVNVNATLPLDIAGLLRAATDQAAFGEIAARLDVNRVRNQVVLNVKSAFYDVLRAQALVNVNAEALQNSLARLDDAQKKFKAGVVAHFDVLRAQTDVANAQQQSIQAKSSVSLMIATLNDNIGIDIDTPLKVSDAGATENPPDVAPPSVPPLAPTPGAPAPGTGAVPVPSPNAHVAQNPQATTPTAPLANDESAGAHTGLAAFDPLDLGPTYRASQKEALRTRPEILEADANIEAARKGIVIAKRSIFPTIGLSLGFVYQPQASGFAPLQTSYEAVAQLNIPLYDGGLARARTREAKADVSTSVTNRRTHLDAVTLEVRQAYINLLQSRDRVAVTNAALGEARESFRLARVRYNAGVSAEAGISPLLEVSDAQNALTQAENSQVNALYDYNNARARLDKAIGRYSYDANPPGYTRPIDVNHPPHVPRHDTGNSK